MTLEWTYFTCSATFVPENVPLKVYHRCVQADNINYSALALVSKNDPSDFSEQKSLRTYNLDLLDSLL